MPRGGRPKRARVAKQGSSNGRKGHTGNERKRRSTGISVNSAGTMPKTKAHNTNRSGRRY
jgi:hypothetical protein